MGLHLRVIGSKRRGVNIRRAFSTPILVILKKADKFLLVVISLLFAGLVTCGPSSGGS